MSDQTKLDRFISSFKNEGELRTAIVALLEKTPNVSNVRLTHGSQERGKDVVFHFWGPFSQRQLVACVIKNEKITGSAESDQGARTVYAQAEQALDTPLANVANGFDERVAQVFIISPYECPPSTVESIKGKLQARPGQVTFLCGRELMEKFEEYYPDFLLFQSGLYGSYIADLQKGLDSDPAVTNVLFRHGFLSGPKTLTALYVRPKFERSLYHYYVKLPPLRRPETLILPLTLDESHTFQNSLRELGRLLTAIMFPDPRGASLQEELQQLCNRIDKGWLEAFGAHRRRTDISAEERNRPKNEISLKLPDAAELDALMRALLEKARAIIHAFDETLSSANSYIELQFTSLATALESPRLLDHCHVEAVSKQVPSIISATLDRKLELGQELIDSSKADFFITGPAGFGKTSFCKWQTLYELKNLREGQSNIIPVYIPLHQYTHGVLGSFESTFLRAPELIALWERRRDESDTDTKTKANSRFRLYLDGLDEVPFVQRQQALMDLALEGKQVEPTMSIVVTGREHVVGGHLKRFVRVRVCDFDEHQVKELAAKWFENDDCSINQFFSQLNKVPSLRPLMRVPLLATLIFGVYRNTKTLPQSRVSLYEMFVSLLAGGWDIAKNIQRETEFGLAPKLTVLTKLAATVHLGRRRDCSQGDFKEAVRRTLPGLRDKWQRILEETVHDGLLIPVGLDYAFAHLSFQEYLAAKNLFEPNGRKAPLAFREFLAGDDWWREVVTFYIGLSIDPKELEEFIRKSAQTVLAKKAADAVKERASFLLEMLMMSFPGAQPTLTL